MYGLGYVRWRAYKNFEFLLISIEAENISVDYKETQFRHDIFT